jgi:hypothetical protein
MLHVVHVADPQAPQLIDTIGLTGDPAAIVVDRLREYAYVACNAPEPFASGVEVYDVWNPISPAPITRMTVPGVVVDMAIDGRYLYLAGETVGLFVADMIRPDAPALVGVMSSPGEALAVCAGEGSSDGLVFIADGSAGVHVVDASDPAAPRITASIALPGPARDIALQDPFLHVACDHAGVQVLEPDGQQAVRLIGSVHGARYAQDLAIADHCVAVGLGEGGCALIARQCGPVHPPAVEIVAFDAVTVEEMIMLSWEVAPHADCVGFDVQRANGQDERWTEISGVRIPLSPEVGCVYTFTDSSVVGGNVYRFRIAMQHADGRWGTSSPIEVRVGTRNRPARMTARVAPNPLRQGVSVDFDLPAAGRLSVQVHDVHGRLVRTLFDADHGAGPGRVSWDRDDRNGNAVPAGVYWISLRCGSCMATRTVVVMQ